MERGKEIVLAVTAAANELLQKYELLEDKDATAFIMFRVAIDAMRAFSGDAVAKMRLRSVVSELDEASREAGLAGNEVSDVLIDANIHVMSFLNRYSDDTEKQSSAQSLLVASFSKCTDFMDGESILALLREDLQKKGAIEGDSQTRH